MRGARGAHAMRVMCISLVQRVREGYLAARFETHRAAHLRLGC